MRRWIRSVRVFMALTPFILAFLRDRRRLLILGSPVRRKEGHHEDRARRLAATIASLGPTFIKLAQVLSARADIFPEPYLSAIATLQDQVPPDDPDRVMKVLEDELGAPSHELFDTIERTPLAAASLGQVHAAQVDGRDVVVKILRPGVEETVALDLAISFRLLFWLNILFPNHHVRALTNVVREFSVKVKEEMDFSREASNIARFRKFFPESSGVRAPRVVDRFTSRRVLVMHRERGTKVNELQARFDSGELRFDTVMERLTGAYLHMMMLDGFLHADPHPGNLLIAEDGDIVILDWGMVLEVPKWTREAILALALAVEREDLDGIINEMYGLGMISPEVSRGEIREAATEIMRIMERARLSNRERVQEIVQEIFDTFYTWPLLLPQELVYFFRASVLLEGIGLRYRPNFDGLGLVRRVVRGAREEILSATTREPVAFARDLLAEAHQVLRSLRELLTRAEREELRVRMHPRDVQGQERFIHLQARRLLFSIFATATAVISAITYISLRNVWLLTAGLLLALFLFVVTVFIPTHLLENPLRHARGIRMEGRRY
jgi:predicted unusual protein kinase regulating ubiquinone biosynthesis (AarF/ABC1/UbiB family)